jgi:hypothetical protein
MDISRKCYLLTGNPNSARAQFSKKILDKIGFNVNFFIFYPHECRPLSNKISMRAIYELIANGEDEWVYVFEDDINVLEHITMSEIIDYEKISQDLFYLGVCMYDHYKVYDTSLKVNNHDVVNVKGEVRGLHAISLSKEGAKKLLLFLDPMSDYQFMDTILEKFTENNPANVIRYDLESYLKGHRGIFFQDRHKFPSTV